MLPKLVGVLVEGKVVKTEAPKKEVPLFAVGDYVKIKDPKKSRIQKGSATSGQVDFIEHDIDGKLFRYHVRFLDKGTPMAYLRMLNPDELVKI